MSPAPTSAVYVDLNHRYRWEVCVPWAHAAAMEYDTFSEACAVANRCASAHAPCHLVVRDAYHRVVTHELLTPT